MVRRGEEKKTLWDLFPRSASSSLSQDLLVFYFFSSYLFLVSRVDNGRDVVLLVIFFSLFMCLLFCFSYSSLFPKLGERRCFWVLYKEAMMILARGFRYNWEESSYSLDGKAILQATICSHFDLLVADQSVNQSPPLHLPLPCFQIAGIFVFNILFTVVFPRDFKVDLGGECRKWGDLGQSLSPSLPFLQYIFKSFELGSDILFCQLCFKFSLDLNNSEIIFWSVFVQSRFGILGCWWDSI